MNTDNTLLATKHFMALSQLYWELTPKIAIGIMAINDRCLTSMLAASL
jgi:hypothetical protein